MDLLERFERYLRARTRSENTIHTYKCHLRKLQRWIDRPMFTDPSVQATTVEVLEFIDEAATIYKPWTVHTIISAVKVWNRWGVLYELWDANGIAQIDAISVKTPLQPGLSPDAARAALHAVEHPWDVRLVYLGLLAGCRISESAAMNESNWLVDRLKFVGKGGKEREVPLHPELQAKREVILSRAAPHRVTLCKRGKKLRYLCDFDWYPHALRRTFAQTLIDADVRLEVVESLMGHAPASTTLQAYASVPWARKVEAIAVLRYGSVPAEAKSA